MEPCVTSENTPKPNFGKKPKRNLTKSTAHTSKPDCPRGGTSQATGRAEQGEERGKQVYTTQVHNLDTNLPCLGYEIKHGTL
jgi:hypothetical protein